MKFDRIRLGGRTTIDLLTAGLTPFDRYLLRDASGLGPPETSVFMAERAKVGGLYQGRYSLNREIVLVIGLNPNRLGGERVSDLRDEIYGLLAPVGGDAVNIDIYNESTRLCRAVGYVKKIETPLFQEDSVIQVTFVCDSPFWEQVSPISLAPSSLTSLAVENEGTAESGFELSITWGATAFNQFSIGKKSGFSVNDAGLFIISAANIFASGDVIRIDTRPGSRGLWRTRAGVQTSLLPYLHPNSKWLSVEPGPSLLDAANPANNRNVFYFYPTSSWSWNYFNYYPRWWGV